MVAKRKRCKECVAEGITTYRKIVPNSGGRCATHHRLRKKELREKRHSGHIEKMYGLTSNEYQQVYEYQGRKCAICRRATGKTKRLSVDHDHNTGEVRMLLCTRCNKMLGHLRDDPEAFERAADCLRNHPVELALGSPRFVPVGGAPVKDGARKEGG